MKRYFPAVLGLCLILIAVTMTDTFSVLDYDTLTIYDRGVETVYARGENAPSTRGKYVRADMTGDLRQVLKDLKAVELFREQIGELTIVYAFSARLKARETVRNKTVNVMIAVNGDRLAVGSPLLKGSY